jgi:hypothetical protein
MLPLAFPVLGSKGIGDTGVALVGARRSCTSTLEVGMGSHRGAHYFLSFLIFGVIAGAASLITQGKVDAEAIWLLVLGGLGAVVGSPRINDGKLARPFDFLAGGLLTVAGLLGTLQGFNIHFLPDVHVGAFQALTATALLGIPLNFPFPALINLFLGVQSLRHGMAKSATV